MKNLFLVLSLFVSINAFAKPLPPDMKGIYLFQNVLKSEDAKNYKVIYAFTESGRKELLDLMAKEYECWNKGRETYLCSKFLHDVKLPESISQDLLNEFSQLAVIFSDKNDGVELLHEGEVYMEWLIHQAVSVGNKSFDRFHIVKTQGITKVTMGEPKGDYISFVLWGDDQSEMELPLTRTISEKDEYTNYLVSLVLRKIK